jgi:hypothetical protein
VLLAVSQMCRCQQQLFAEEMLSRKLALTAFERLWRDTGCGEVLQELLADRGFEFRVERAVFLTVLHRLMIAGSDRACEQWRDDYRTRDRVFAAIAGWVGPMITPKVGQRGIAIAGFGIVLVSLLVAAGSVYTGHIYVLPFAAAAMLWGHYWAASNCMTIPTVVAKPEYRGTASGFAYMFVKLPSFLAIFLFPALFAAIGQADATLFIAIFPLIGLLAAILILQEIYGFEHD